MNKLNIKEVAKERVLKLGGHFFPQIFPQVFSWIIIAETV